VVGMGCDFGDSMDFNVVIVGLAIFYGVIKQFIYEDE
jgi:hypothetical protein